MSVIRKENILRNSKQTRKKKYKKHLEKLILNIAETLHNEFLPDHFCFHGSKKATSKDATLLLRHVANLEINPVDN